MKQSIPVFLILLFSFLTLRADTEDTEDLTSPVYLGAILIDETSAPRAVKLCKAYNYQEKGEDAESFLVFISPAGEKIRYKTDGTTTIVEVTTKEKQSDIRRQLEESKFKKDTNGYIRGSRFYPTKTTCTISTSPTRLYFIKQPNK